MVLNSFWKGFANLEARKTTDLYFQTVEPKLLRFAVAGVAMMTIL